MLERDLNGIIRKSFSEQGQLAHKISDSGFYQNGAVSHTQQPFDLFAYYNGYFVAVESKFLNKPGSLDLQRLQDHQLDALKKTKTLKYSYALFIVGINYGTADKRVYVFDDLDYIEQRRTNRQNILKKEWDIFTNYVTIKHGVINIEELLRTLERQPHLQ